VKLLAWAWAWEAKGRVLDCLLDCRPVCTAALEKQCIRSLHPTSPPPLACCPDDKNDEQNSKTAPDLRGA